jgi:hypothetical protein
MNKIDFGSVGCPVFIGVLSEHAEIKDKILHNINNMKEAERIVNEKTDTNITRCDWTVPREVNREYIPFFMPALTNYMGRLIEIIGYDACDIHNIWFQQYTKNSTHDWHVHLQCQWTNVYYVEMPEDAPQTQLLIPWENNKVITLDVKEGQMVTFPSFVIHKAPTVESDTRKTIISYNCDFNITDKIIKEKYNF